MLACTASFTSLEPAGIQNPQFILWRDVHFPVLGNLVAGTEVVTSSSAVMRSLTHCSSDWNYPPLAILESLSYTIFFLLCIENENIFLESFSVIIIH